MLRVLWLCSWYPNKIHPFEGDFIQRYAQAVSLFNNVDVYKITPDPAGSGVVTETSLQGRFPNLTETHIYYPKGKSVFAAAVSHYRWLTLYKKAVRRYIREKGKPDLVHVQVPFKCGIIGRWLLRRYHIPYIVTEHWGGYNNAVPDNFKTRPVWFRNIIQQTFYKAAAIHSVSNYLGKAIHRIVQRPCFVLNNVADTSFFYYKTKPPHETFECLHVSNGAPVKNIDGIIRTFQKLVDKGISLTIMGLPDQLNTDYKQRYPFVRFTGERPYNEVADALRATDLLVIFSNSENSPCVIGEALCCGTPVVATNVGGISELIHEDNGMLISAGDETALAETVLHMRENYHQYEPMIMAQQARDIYSYEVLGMHMSEQYKKVLQ